jgi:hypothetical protein
MSNPKEKYKKKDYRQLSNKRCVSDDCKNYLKQNLVDKNPNADKCFRCYQRLVKHNPHYMTPAERTKYFGANYVYKPKKKQAEQQIKIVKKHDGTHQSDTRD